MRYFDPIVSVLPLFEKSLDRKYTLLRNITLPGLDACIPIILVGPAGIYVCVVTDKAGMYRAKGDQWGIISGEIFKPDKINLVTRTEQFARAVQVYLQNQGRFDIPGVEPVLLCTNPSIHVDSIRPIVRIVLRDALERFIISISEISPVIGQDIVIKVVDFITNPVSTQFPSPIPAVEMVPGDLENEIPIVPADTPSLASEPDAYPTDGNLVPSSEDQAVSDSSTPVPIPITPPVLQEDSSTLEAENSQPGEPVTFVSSGWQTPASLPGDLDSLPGMIPLQSELSPEPSTSPLPESLFPGYAKNHAETEPVKSPAARRKAISGKQWLILAGLALVWIILIAILLFFILKDFIL